MPPKRHPIEAYLEDVMGCTQTVDLPSLSGFRVNSLLHVDVYWDNAKTEGKKHIGSMRWYKDEVLICVDIFADFSSNEKTCKYLVRRALELSFKT